jgi:hypothetical protein
VRLLEREPHAPHEVQRLAVLLRQLHAARAVQHRELLGDRVLGPVVVGLRAAHHLGRRAAVADGDRALHVLGHARVVRHDDDRRAELAVHGAQALEDVVRRRGVELAGGLVREQHLRGVGEPDGDRDALLLAARHLARPPVGAVADAEDVEQLRRARGPIAAADARESERERDVLGRGQVRHQVARRLLPDEPDHRAPVVDALPRRHRHEVPVAHAHPAGGRHVEPREHGQQRGLAGAGRAHDRHELAGLDEQVEALERLHLDALRLVDAHERVAHDERVLAERARAGACALLERGERRLVDRRRHGLVSLVRRIIRAVRRRVVPALIVRPPAAPRRAGRDGVRPTRPRPRRRARREPRPPRRRRRATRP